MAEHETMTPDLSPAIALFYILPRLPVKSVTRFKCVSKQWHSFITTPRFRKMHLHHQNHEKLLLLPNNRPWEFFTIDCETPEDGCTAIRPLPFKVVPGDRLSIVKSLHGMLCVLLTKVVGMPRIHSDIILWNPVTGEHKTLSKTGSHKDCYETYQARYGLYYSSSEDDYKLVCLTHYPIINVYMYSLKSDSWRKVESTGWSSDQYEYSNYLKQSVLLNGKLYFPNSYSLIIFDTKTEKLRAIETPYFGNQRTRCIGYMVVKGFLHFRLASRNSEGRYDTIGEWRMYGDGDWTKVETSSLVVHSYKCYDQPCHLMSNRKWLMYSDTPQKLMRDKYWLMNNPWEGCVYVKDAKTHTKHIICSIRYAFRRQGKFIETFVSPNQYISQVLKPCTLLT